ncbi:11194_t:CDS:2 [Cetraspora pellucida]|uniref:11194_t:CDS:1 n=1 Tax=Cetraspora pellucida TaxID=1433469 RepID=A0ACA9KFK2_9GLOM|nr:11194_t:CDS:2 [Cetraspora pellucida]
MKVYLPLKVGSYVSPRRYWTISFTLFDNIKIHFTFLEKDAINLHLLISSITQHYHFREVKFHDKHFQKKFCPSIQVYNFNIQRWNDPQYSQSFIPNDFVTDFWGPRAVWLRPGLMCMWGSILQYNVHINVNPWQWTILPYNKALGTISQYYYDGS